METDKPRVRVRHYRNREEGINKPQWYVRGYGFVQSSDGKFVFEKTPPAIRGGLTEAWIAVDGKEFWAEANCSVKDSFCYALGSTIARGRLRKQLEQAGLENMI